MWPSHATLYLVPCTAQQEHDDKITFWKNICGLDFSSLMYVMCVYCVNGDLVVFCFSPLAYHQFYSVPIYNHILNDKDRLSEVQSILKLHLKTITLGDIEVCVSLYVHYCVVV